MISHPTLSKRVLQWSTRPYVFCPLQALLLGPHCLPFFASPLCSNHPCLLDNLTLACLRAFASAVLFLLGLLFLRYPHVSHSSFKSLHLLVRTSLIILQHYKYPLSPLPSHILKNPLSPCHGEETQKAFKQPTTAQKLERL